MSKQHRLFEQWLARTGCKDGYGYKKRHIVAENDEYILFKHDSHAVYAGRFATNTTITCEAYAVLYRKADLETKAAWADFAIGNAYFHKWENCGRLTTKRLLKEAKEKFDIDFDGEYRSKEWHEVESHVSPEVQKLIEAAKASTSF